MSIHKHWGCIFEWLGWLISDTAHSVSMGWTGLGRDDLFLAWSGLATVINEVEMDRKRLQMDGVVTRRTRGIDK